MIATIGKHVAAWLLVSLATGCILARQTEVPIPTLQAESASDAARALVIMLPGRGDRMDRFVEQSFIPSANARNFDVLVADAHLGYYRDRSLTTRLHEDIIVDARDGGYTDIWILGISLGGLGAALYANDHPESINGVILIAPFLGEAGVAEDILAAGGLLAWDNQSATAEEFELAAWNGLQTASRMSSPKMVLAYGADDALSETYAPLLEVLPDSSVFVGPGGHRWSAWKPLWQQIQASGIID